MLGKICDISESTKDGNGGSTFVKWFLAQHTEDVIL